MEDNIDNPKNLKIVNVDCSPSYLFNNLTQSKNTFLFIHNSEHQSRGIFAEKRILENFSTSESTSNSKFLGKFLPTDVNDLCKVKFLFIQNNYYLGLGLHGGFQVWTSDGNRLLTQIPSKNTVQDKPYTFNAFTEYKVNPKNTADFDSIICADSYGQMFILIGSDQAWKTKQIYLNNNSYGIATDITFEKTSRLITCSYENGDIFIMTLKNDGNIQVIKQLENSLNIPTFCLASISAPSPLLIAGYINGEIKIHKLTDSYDFVTSLGDHLRMITSLVTYNNYIISSGEDSYVNIFRIDDNLKIQLVSCHEIPNRIPVGLTIIPVSEKMINIVVTCYDYNCLVYLDNIQL